MPWGVVFLLAMFTGGLFGFIWLCIQAAYVKRIDPSSKARMLIVFGVLASVAQVVLSFAATAAAYGGSVSGAYGSMALMFALMLASMICMLAAIFGMRGSLVRYFNTVEPIGLRLSGVMTFFFSILYFQHHLSRIAAMKRR